MFLYKLFWKRIAVNKTPPYLYQSTIQSHTYIHKQLLRAQILWKLLFVCMSFCAFYFTLQFLFIWIWNRLLSDGIEPVLRQTGKSCIASNYRQLLRPKGANITGFILLIFHFDIRGKLSIIRCDIWLLGRRKIIAMLPMYAVILVIISWHMPHFTQYY